MKKIAIIGGHGKIALLLTPLLSADGMEVSAIIRNADQAGDVAAAGALPVVHDVETSSVDELAAVLAGYDAAVWSAGAGGGNPERTYAVDRDAAIRSMDAATQAGVKRYVMVSYLGARTDHGVPPGDSFFAYAEAKAAADAHLRGTGLDWTILGPGALTLDPASGHINTGAETASRNTSRANVALVAAAVLQRPDTIRRTVAFTDGQTPIGEALNP